MPIEGEKHIRGYADLAKFLTENGFPISRMSLSKIKPEDAPPIAGRWANAYIYAPSAVIAWATARRDGNRTRRKGVPKKVTPAPVAFTESLPPAPPVEAIVAPSVQPTQAVSPPQPAEPLLDDDFADGPAF
jgi:hypothetical protein